MTINFDIGLSWLERKLLLHDKGIREAIDRGLIRITPNITPDQIQPGSLDVRIGKVRVYDKESMKLGAMRLNNQANDEEPTTEFSKIYPDIKDIKITIPPKSFVEIFFHEKIFYNNDYSIIADLRSSRGRFGLCLADRMVHSENGEQYLRLWNNNPNPIRLYGHDKFAQIFFHTKNEKALHNGYTVINPSELNDLVKEITDRDNITIGPYMMFFVGDNILKFKKKIGVIDTKNIISDEELYDFFDAKKEVKIMPEEASIIQLEPRIKLPANIGLRLLHDIPYALSSGLESQLYLACLISQAHRANAGWVDPGFEGRLTGHPNIRACPIRLKKGDFFALGEINKYFTNVDNPYGSESLNSHYDSDDIVSRN
jgi:deoxycytidine triphosphate deaminase